MAKEILITNEINDFLKLYFKEHFRLQILYKNNDKEVYSSLNFDYIFDGGMMNLKFIFNDLFIKERLFYNPKEFSTKEEIIEKTKVILTQAIENDVKDNEMFSQEEINQIISFLRYLEKTEEEIKIEDSLKKKIEKQTADSNVKIRREKKGAN